jgi:hypothetical protein
LWPGILLLLKAKDIPVGKRVGEWIYELFITTLDAEGFLVEDVLDHYQGRGAFEAVLADEDVEADPDRGRACIGGLGARPTAQLNLSDRLPTSTLWTRDFYVMQRSRAVFAQVRRMQAKSAIIR